MSGPAQACHNSEFIFLLSPATQNNNKHVIDYSRISKLLSKQQDERELSVGSHLPTDTSMFNTKYY